MASVAEYQISEFRDQLESASDVEGLMRLAIEQIITRYHAEVAILLTPSESLEAICWAGTAAALPGFLIPGLPARIEANDLAGRAFKSGQIQVALEPGWMMKEQTVIVAPIKLDARILGLLRASSDRFKASDPLLLSTFEVIAGYIAKNLVRFESSAHPESPHGVTTPSSLPPTVSAQVSIPVDTHHLCERVYRGIAGLMICDRFFISLNNRNKTAELVYQVENGMELPASPVSLEQEMITYVTRLRAGVIVTQREREVRFQFSRGESGQDIQSAVCVPLIANSNVLGTMSVQSCRASSYSDIDLKLLTVCADLMAMVLQNIQK
jgi:hypothetical protein